MLVKPTCYKCDSSDLRLDDRKSTSCKTCGSIVNVVWICHDCGAEIQTMTWNPRIGSMKDSDKVQTSSIKIKKPFTLGSVWRGFS